jgi:hypothetical protein
MLIHIQQNTNVTSDQLENWLYIFFIYLLQCMFRRRTEMKIEDVLGKDQFGLEEEKELGMQLGC